MKAIDFLKRLESKEFYKQFKKENLDMYLCAFFCILEKEETEGDKIHIDFFIPSTKKIIYSESPFQEMTFSKDEGKELTELKNLNSLKVDLEDLWNEVERIKKEKNITHNTGKIMAVLANKEWILTCLSPSLDFLRIKLNAFTGEVLSTKKESLGDIMNVVKKDNNPKTKDL